MPKKATPARVIKKAEKLTPLQISLMGTKGSFLKLAGKAARSVGRRRFSRAVDGRPFVPWAQHKARLQIAKGKKLYYRGKALQAMSGIGARTETTNPDEQAFSQRQKARLGEILRKEMIAKRNASRLRKALGKR